jgi:hypothetical protein
MTILLDVIYYVVYQYIFETVRTHTTQKYIFSCGLNVILDRSGHSTVEIICFFIVSGLKYHSIHVPHGTNLFLYVTAE